MRKSGHRAFSLVELLVVITIIGILVALLLPAVQAAREAARRIQCCNNLKQIGLALHAYSEARGVFPPGCIVSTGTPPGWQPWQEAKSTLTQNQHGTSWMLQILPYIEQQNLYGQWDFRTNVVGNASVAQQDIAGFYCPSRRRGVRSEDQTHLLVHAWTGGGNDYGGCLGSGNGWTNDSLKYFTEPRYLHDPEHWLYPDRIGIFRPNVPTAFAAIRDGSANTIMTGELQRLLHDSTDYRARSQDGWAVGGSATLFTTNDDEAGANSGIYQRGGINNGFFEAPGSEHVDGAYFGMADGSVCFLRNEIDVLLFRYLGGMADGRNAQLP